DALRVDGFTIELQRLLSWKRIGGQSTVVLVGRKHDDTALQWLAASLGMLVVRSGVRTGGIPPRPHMTLAYHPTMISALVLPVPIVIAAKAVHLVRNHRGQSFVEELACYPLR